MTGEAEIKNIVGQGDRRLRRGNRKRRLNSRYANMQTIEIKPKEKWETIETIVEVPIFMYIKWVDKFKDGTKRVRKNSKGEPLYKKIFAGYEKKHLITKRLAKSTYKTIIQYNYPPDLNKKIYEYKQQIEEEKRKRKEEQEKLEKHYKDNKVCPTCKKKTERGEVKGKLCTDPWHAVYENIQEQKKKADEAK